VAIILNLMRAYDDISWWCLMFGNTGFLTAINCFDVKLSARGQSAMTLTSITTLIIMISVSGVVWSITGSAITQSTTFLPVHDD